MVSQLLQHYSSRISGATLSEESVDLLHTEGLISEETLREVKSCGYTLTDDAMREIYTTVAYDHNKLKSFVKILLRSTGTVSITNDLMRDCGKKQNTLIELCFFKRTFLMGRRVPMVMSTMNQVSLHQIQVIMITNKND